jgi:hypothetical protein
MISQKTHQIITIVIIVVLFALMGLTLLGMIQNKEIPNEEEITPVSNVTSRSTSAYNSIEDSDLLLNAFTEFIDERIVTTGEGGFYNNFSIRYWGDGDWSLSIEYIDSDEIKQRLRINPDEHGWQVFIDKVELVYTKKMMGDV